MESPVIRKTPISGYSVGSLQAAHMGASAFVTFNVELVELVNGDLVVPGHALHEKGLQRQIAVGTLVNSQQRRALAVPRLNRWSTAGQPLVNRTFCSSTGLHRISFVRACEETFRTFVYGTLEG